MKSQADEGPIDATLTLVARQWIDAGADWLFDAWTTPAHLLAWWGPNDVMCIAAEIDLQVGGGYRLGNQLPDGSVVWISGQFETIQRPHRLVFSWHLGTEEAAQTSTHESLAGERVTVRFVEQLGGTEVIVLHERIGSTEARDSHVNGWEGCLAGLTAFADARPTL